MNFLWNKKRKTGKNAGVLKKNGRIRACRRGGFIREHGAKVHGTRRRVFKSCTVHPCFPPAARAASAAQSWWGADQKICNSVIARAKHEARSTKQSIENQYIGLLHLTVRNDETGLFGQPQQTAG
jgi:hypothetical protein